MFTQLLKLPTLKGHHTQTTSQCKRKSSSCSVFSGTSRTNPSTPAVSASWSRSMRHHPKVWNWSCSTWTNSFLHLVRKLDSGSSIDRSVPVSFPNSTRSIVRGSVHLSKTRSPSTLRASKSSKASSSSKPSQHLEPGKKSTSSKSSTPKDSFWRLKKAAINSTPKHPLRKTKKRSSTNSSKWSMLLCSIWKSFSRILKKKTKSLKRFMKKKEPSTPKKPKNTKKKHSKNKPKTLN